MPRLTKQDLTNEVYTLRARLAVAESRIRALEVKPGVFYTGWRNTGTAYAARPKCQDPDTQLWLEKGAYETLMNGDWDSEEDKSHQQLVVPVWDDAFPPGIEAAVIQYRYDNDNGIWVEHVWPAVKLPQED